MPHVTQGLERVQITSAKEHTNATIFIQHLGNSFLFRKCNAPKRNDCAEDPNKKTIDLPVSSTVVVVSNFDISRFVSSQIKHKANFSQHAASQISKRSTREVVRFDGSRFLQLDPDIVSGWSAKIF